MVPGYVLISGITGGVGIVFAAECAGRRWGLLLTDIHEDTLSRLAKGLRRLYRELFASLAT
jgi:short-subunit dehydrogenase